MVAATARLVNKKEKAHGRMGRKRPRVRAGRTLGLPPVMEIDDVYMTRAFFPNIPANAPQRAMASTKGMADSSATLAGALQPLWAMQHTMFAHW
jgi:hypothetical protein